MNEASTDTLTLAASCKSAVQDAVRAIPPVWPLAATVAVNPFLGQAHQTLASTAARLGRVAGQPVTMPRDWYARRVADGEILDDDLEAALQATTAAHRPQNLGELEALLERPSPQLAAVPTVADLASRPLGIDCPTLIAERIGFFAASYFDAGQAMWPASREGGAYKQWQAFAARDLTPEITGVAGFATHVDHAPDDAERAIERAVETLGLDPSQLETYFHTLLTSLGGWAQLARYELWQAELEGAGDSAAHELLAIRLVWEEALFELCGNEIHDGWLAAKAAHGEELAPSRDQLVDTILQEASERAQQRRLAALLADTTVDPVPGRPLLHAVFCIDVRSEVFRRALEALDPRIRTSGFAGFFGLPTAHQGLASDVAEHRLPVLLPATLGSRTDVPEATDLAARYLARAKRAWGRFKLAAVSSFAFVESAGPIYIGKLLRDALGWMSPASSSGPRPVLEPLDIETRVETAATILRAMSMTGDFASVVVLLGHGASVVNNPHASALHCGACGGYPGDVNARLLAGLLNERAVRDGLGERGIDIPDDTWFVGGRHDTTTDRVVLFDAEDLPTGIADRLPDIRQWLAAAGAATRLERATRLPRASDNDDVLARSRDWSEIRPEWALAGCSAFIAAPRDRTAGRNLAGRAFLHDYDWQKDEGFGVLELIMTAPVVVAGWISLQYYGSTVAPDIFGGGNKLLHNVVGGIGVVEGNGGLLRPGLPWQSVHDGAGLAHDPLRLSVCIEAPVEAMNEILERHDHVRALFDNRWLHLFALDAKGRMAWRYTGQLDWEAVEDASGRSLAEVA